MILRLVETKSKPVDKKKRRGMERQQEIREIEAEIRRTALITSKWMVSCCSKTWEESAKCLCIATSTLRKWRLEYKKGKKPKPRGRRPKPITAAKQGEIEVLLCLLGPSTSIEKLRGRFPTVPKEQLMEIRANFGDFFREKLKWVIKSMKWAKAGTVWAMDFTQPPCIIEETYVKILIVRDLASGNQLLSLPVTNENSKITIDALKALFLEHGAPLVMKNDNGSPFGAFATQDFLDSEGVLQLFSPPGTPEYNGAVEAGIGSFKVSAHYSSAKNDHPGEWTCDDLEAARCEMNEFGRPHGISKESPEEIFEKRECITENERLEFWCRYKHILREVMKKEGLGNITELKEMEKRSVCRESLSDTLLELEYLTTKKRRVSPPFKRLKVI